MSNKSAYTLIELLVVVSIIGILAAVGIASYSDFTERRIGKKASEDFKSYIRIAASKAMNNEKDCRVDVCGGDTDGCSGEPSEKALDGWYIDFSTSPPEIYGECDGTVFPTPAISLKGLIGVSISLDQAIEKIQFYPLGEGTDLSSSLTISINGTEALTVDPSGNVSNF